MKKHISSERADDEKVSIRIEKIYQLHNQELLRYLIGLTHGDHSKADDIAQESFCALTRHLKLKKEITHARGLLFQIAKNVLIDHHRKEKTQVYISDIDVYQCDIASQAPSQEQIISGEEELNQLEKLISSLPPRCREVFILSRFENMTYPQIAHHCGISVSMVEKHVKKALVIIGKNMRVS